MLGIIVALVYLFSFYYKPKITLKQKIIIAIIGIALFTGIYMYKAASSNGRLLIYTITFTQLKAKDYILGLGIGKFKATYNLLQAEYYSTHNINSTQSQLADNVSYLYNDWLQALLEIGLVGLLILVIIIFLFYKIFIRKKNIAKHNKILQITNTILIAISVAALFNFPLQSIYIFIPFILCVSIHFYFYYQLRTNYNYAIIKRIKNFLLGILALFALYYSIIIYKYKCATKEAITLSLSGYKTEAISIFEKLEKYPFADYEATFQHAVLLFQVNKLPEALKKLKKSEQLNISDVTYKLKADIYYELGNNIEAEKNYLVAVYMIPNRMVSKFNLMQFYLKTNQKEKATYWANAILTMKIKIPSNTTNDIKNNTKLILEKLSYKIES